MTAQDITMTENGARVECVDRDGHTFVIQADYLVGAGGTHSKLRSTMEKRLEGITYPRNYLVADVVASTNFCSVNSPLATKPPPDEFTSRRFPRRETEASSQTGEMPLVF